MLKKKILTIKHVNEHHAHENKKILDIWMWESFHNKSGATVSRKNMSINNYVQMCKILENNLLLSQNETPSKRKRPKFLLALGDFLYKFFLNNTVFQSLSLDIVAVWELIFWSVSSYFSCRFLYLNRKPIFRLLETSFF